MTNLETDVARKIEIKDQMERLQQELDAIDDRLREQGYGEHEAGAWNVLVQHNRRLNAGRFKDAFPVARYPHLYSPSVNTAAIKEHLAPKDLEQYYDEGRPVVRVR